jgi:hypothetical protein
MKKLKKYQIFISSTYEDLKALILRLDFDWLKRFLFDFLVSPFIIRVTVFT